MSRPFKDKYFNFCDICKNLIRGIPSKRQVLFFNKHDLFVLFHPKAIYFL